MKRFLILFVVLGQIGVLVSMALQREWIARHGRHISLRTAPYDPNDPMRGEYSRLNYEISQVPAELCRDGVRDWLKGAMVYSGHRDARVYAVLDIDAEDHAQLVALTDHKPTSGLYLRGRVRSTSPDWINISYGIEALFTEQGRAAALDRERLGRYAGAPLDADVAVSPDGIAVLEGVHWGKLALTLKIQRQDNGNFSTGNPRPKTAAGATVTLKNVSDSPVTVVLRPHGRSFKIESTSRVVMNGVVWINHSAELPMATADDLKTLAPGETTEQSIDFSDPYWSIRVPLAGKKNEASPPMLLPNFDNGWVPGLRLEYVPGPDRISASNVPANLVKVPVATRTFSIEGSD